MKIKKFKFKQLLKLHLLKLKAYEQLIKKTNFNDLININLDQILVDVKKALRIIFQYHQAEKRILFIGFPYKLELKINRLTRHVAVSNNFNIQGLISNNNNKLLNENRDSSQAWLKSHIHFLLPKVTKTPNLIILFKHEKSQNVLNEAWAAKIPVIIFTSDCELQDLSSENFYIVRGNFKNVWTIFDENIFFIGLNFLFKNSFKKRKLSPI